VHNGAQNQCHAQKLVLSMGVILERSHPPAGAKVLKLELLY
jgi:hypothetical protein